MYVHAGMWLFSIRGGAILPHHGMARHVVSRGRRELGGGGDWTFPFKVPVVWVWSYFFGSVSSFYNV